MKNKYEFWNASVKKNNNNNNNNQKLFKVYCNWDCYEMLTCRSSPHDAAPASLTHKRKHTHTHTHAHS